MNGWLLSKQQTEIMTALENFEDVTELVEKFEDNKIKATIEVLNVLELLEMAETGTLEKVKEWQERKKKITEQISRAKNSLIKLIQEYGEEGKIVFNGVKISIKKNPPKLQINEPESIPDEYKTITITINKSDLKEIDSTFIDYKIVSEDVDKAKIKELNKSGIGIAGTEVIQEISLKR